MSFFAPLACSVLHDSKFIASLYRLSLRQTMDVFKDTVDDVKEILSLEGYREGLIIAAFPALLALCDEKAV